MSLDYAEIFRDYTEPCAPGAVLCRVSDIERQELQWLWPARIPLAKLTLFAGDPGLGKSFVTLDIAARVTRGMEWPDGAAATCKSGSVIILSAEDDPGDTIRPRLEAAGADLSKVYVLQAVRRAKPSGETSFEQFSLETDLLALQDAVVSLSDARLIVIDPVSAYLGGIDSHVNAKVRSLLAPLSQMAATTGVAVLAVTHLNKNSSSALYRASGSVAFVAAARAVWLFAKNPDDPALRVMVPGKMNLAPEQSGIGYQLEAKQDVAVVTWGGAVSVSADAVLEPEGAERRSERFEAMDWLRGQLADGPVPQRKIKTDAAREGFSWATLRRAKDALGITTEKSGFQGASLWRLKDALSKDAHPIDTQVSTFEQAVENTNLNGVQTSKDAQHSEVKTFDAFEDDGEVRL
jgi:putative DNA primase/helicase